MKNPLRRRNHETLPVYLERRPDGHIVAFGDPAAIELLSSSFEELPGPLVRSARAAFATADELTATAENAMGAVLSLAPEARRLLDEHAVFHSGATILGVLRGDDGRLVQQLRVVSAGADVMGKLQGLTAGVAVQQQLASIETRLDRLQSSIDYVADDIHTEVEAELTAAIGILGDVYADVMRHAELSNDQWMQIANVELPIKTQHERTLAHLRTLEDALTEPEAPLRTRVTRLAAAMRDQHADTWLNLHVQADQALTQWESLHLLRQLDGHPERADALVEATTDGITQRHEAMVGLAEAIATYLDDGGQTHRLLDRLRIISRARLADLLHHLDSMLKAYRGAAKQLGLEMAHLPEDRTSVGTGPASSWAVLMGELNSVPGRAMETAGGLVKTAKARLQRRKSEPDEP